MCLGEREREWPGAMRLVLEYCLRVCVCAVAVSGGLPCPPVACK